ncbi:MAG: SDR family oxidoreductase [bacterium]|nr:MAG: SDR family oxidoreductase [bacterium]
MKRFDGKRALITGGSKGIGRAIALRLASEGADCIINFVKDEQSAAATASEIEKLGAGVLPIQADISEPKEIKALFSRIKDEFGGLDCFVSNAVSGVLGPAERIGRFGWDRALNTNTRAFMLGVQQAIKLFPETGGKIVAVSSIGSFYCLPGYSAVGASKAALETLVRYFARELAPRGINVNAVSGGPVNTSALEYFPDREQLLEAWKERSPVQRIAEPEEIASVVAFLLSEDAAWIQGHTIVADGGLTL